MQPANLPVITAIAAGVLVVGQMILLLTVVRLRRSAHQSLGDGGNAGLLRATRRHGNYAENAAIFLIGLALLELLGADRPFVIAVATVFIAGRIAHAIGLSMEKTVNPWRIAGIFATVAVGLAMGTRLLTLGLTHLH